MTWWSFSNPCSIDTPVKKDNWPAGYENKVTFFGNTFIVFGCSAEVKLDYTEIGASFCNEKLFYLLYTCKSYVMDITANHAEQHVEAATMSQTEKVITILRWTYGLVPIVAGADKFMHLLTDWDKYLAPPIADLLPMQPHTFMSIVGIIEIVAGVLVLAKPKIGSLIVGLWLIGIAINLLLTGQYYDVAVRDLVMAIGAFSLCMLASDRSEA